MNYSTHSIRVWVCASLGKTGKFPDFIKKRLRSPGESYRVYLNDTHKINHQHIEALKDFPQTVKNLIDSDLISNLKSLSKDGAKVSGEHGDGN